MKWFFFLIPLLCVSCAIQNGGLVEQRWRKSPSAWVNGAEVYSEIEPQKGEGALEKSKLIYSAQTSDFDGPLKLRIVAEGTRGEQETMRVEAIQINTGRTNRSVNVPADFLGEENLFILEPIKKPKKPFSLKKQPKEKKEEEEVPRWMAVYTFPDTLQLFPKVDGKVVIAAKVRIKTKDGSHAEWVNFGLLPNPDKSKSFFFRQTMIEHGGEPIL